MKYRLLAPGPTPVPERVLTAMANPIWHHRTPAFEAILKDCQEGLQWLFQTEGDDDALVLSLASSGTGAMEAAFQTFFAPGDTVITVGGGKFGERWGIMANQLGLKAVVIDVEWGRSVEIAAVEAALKEHPEAKAVVSVASETSTGVRQPYEAIGALTSKMDGCLNIVDGITAVGVWDIQPKRDLIDVLITGSQKAMMLPPGLAFVYANSRAWKRADDIGTGLGHYYFDLKKERKNQAKNTTAYTPAVSLFVGLKESLAMMKKEGREKLFARHARMAKAARRGAEALGLKLLAENPADSVTSVWAPDVVKPNGVVTGLRDRANITIAGGQDALKGKIFRLAHLGYFDEIDILTTFGALEIVLRQEGYTDFAPGAGVGAASEILAEGFVANDS
ncbi:MAG: alanine--glyoxylate aminotransferase family protein [Deltaproteobacteria bacterium]|nr:alanine--glyoxylate aminotransferase family protein [Deltaproteobacteria bacterium]